MIPILFDRYEKGYSNSRGLGTLKDAFYCNVKERKNGEYGLTLEYPIDGPKFNYLKEENILYASTPRGAQPFRIYYTETDATEGIVTVYADHIFYDLEKNIIEDTNIVEKTAAGALSQLLSKCLFNQGFTSTSDIETVANSRLVRRNPVEAILDTSEENCIINRWGGELEREGRLIYLHQRYGEDRGVAVKYRKNLTGLKVKTNVNAVATYIMPKGFDGLLLPEKYVKSDLSDQYVHPYVAIYEFSNIKAIKEGETTQDEDAVPVEEAYEMLRAAAKELFNKEHVDIPETTFEVNMVELSKTNEYKNYKVLETIYPFDTVTIKHEKLGINIKVDMNYYEWDSLNEEYITLEFGNNVSNFASTLNNVKSIYNKIENMESNFLEIAKRNATDLINTGLGGYVVKTRDEILIMDTDDINTATKVWRWNKNGLGYSSTGYNGTYGMAMTKDGAIVADFITAGTMAANRIRTGVLTAVTIENKDSSFQINLAGYGGATCYTKGKKSLDLASNRINFYNWGKEGDYIGSIGSVNNISDAHPEGDPDRPNISVYNDLDSSVSIDYKLPTGSATTHKGYVVFDKYNIQPNHTKPVKFIEGVEFSDEVYHWKPINMQGWPIYLESSGNSKVETTTVNSTYKSVKMPHLWVDGKLWVSSSEVTGGDYAECFEWADGNTKGEDRTGLLVQLKGNKIELANGTDILGVISDTASIIGDNANEWQGKYIKDCFGRYVLDKEGNKIISEEFDSEKEYLTRRERKEWGVVGLLGKVYCRCNKDVTSGDYIEAVDGIAVKSKSKTNARVLEVNKNVARLLIK